MSTRATIKVTKNNETLYRIYHHCDGYPEGVGAELLYFFSNVEDEYWSSSKLEGILDSEAYEFEYNNVDMHGDEEYEYEIDLDKKTISCYDIYEKKYISLYNLI